MNVPIGWLPVVLSGLLARFAVGEQLEAVAALAPVRAAAGHAQVGAQLARERGTKILVIVCPTPRIIEILHQEDSVSIFTWLRRLVRGRLRWNERCNWWPRCGGWRSVVRATAREHLSLD